MPDFIKIELIDIIDIIIVAFLIYQGYKSLRGTSALTIFFGIILFYFIWLISKALNMELLSTIMGQVIGVGVLAIIVIFQQEIRRFFMLIGYPGRLWDEAQSSGRYYRAIRRCGNCSVGRDGRYLVCAEWRDKEGE